MPMMMVFSATGSWTMNVRVAGELAVVAVDVGRELGDADAVAGRRLRVGSIGMMLSIRIFCVAASSSPPPTIAST